MSDHLSRLMALRVAAAKSLLPSAKVALMDGVRAVYQAEMRRLGFESDPEAAQDYISATIERDLLLAFRGYSDWLASHIWRDTIARDVALPARLELPRLTQERIDALSMQVDAAPEIFGWLGNHLSTARTDLPGIGVVNRGVLDVDRNALREWANCFDWTNDGRQTAR